MILPVIKRTFGFYPMVEVKPELPQADIAIVVGHHKFAKGAYSPHLKAYEWDFNNKVVEHVKSNVDIYFHNPNIRGYRSRQKAMAKRLNKKSYKLVLELHFNASDSPSANGAECLYYFKNKVGKTLSNLFCKVIHNNTDIKNRGAKALYNSKDRGYWFLYYPKATALILEPGFGTNYDDCINMTPQESLAKDIDDFINVKEMLNS